MKATLARTDRDKMLYSWKKFVEGLGESDVKFKRVILKVLSTDSAVYILDVNVWLKVGMTLLAPSPTVFSV